MNRLTIQFLVHQGYHEAASKFSQETGTKLENLGMIEERSKINQLILRGEVENAISEINKIDVRILRQNEILTFRLKLQLFVGEMKKDWPDLMKALEFANSELSPFIWRDEKLKPIFEKAMSLMAFKKPEDSPGKNLLEP